MHEFWTFMQGAEPWFILVLLGALAKAQWAERAASTAAKEWQKLATAAIEAKRKSEEIARKNYEAGLSWKAAFEKRRLPTRAETPKQARAAARPVLGHCHDPRCEARELKVHACHDLTCKQHVHEKRAR